MRQITTKELREMFFLSYESIKKNKEEIDKINIFPMPDKDTGVNLTKTLLGIKKAIEKKNFKDLDDFISTVLDSALEVAQGNAGVIYAGFLAGFLSAFQNKNPINSKKLAEAMVKGAKLARESIYDPKEGTILDVIDAAADTIKKESKKDYDILSLFKKAVKRANKALLATRDKMEIFRKANVVDAGGLGYLIILEGYTKALEESEDTIKEEKKALGKVRRFIQDLFFRYEVIFLIKNPKISQKELFQKLSKIGNSIEILKIKDKVKVHIHTNDPDKLKKIAREFGKIKSIKVEDIIKRN